MKTIFVFSNVRNFENKKYNNYKFNSKKYFKCF